MKEYFKFSILLVLVGCIHADPPANNGFESTEAPLFIKSKSDYPMVVQSVIRDTVFDFRGVSLGMTLDEVRSIEENNTAEIDSLMIRYTEDIGIDNSIESVYLFSEDSILVSSEISVYCSSMGVRDSLYSNLKEYHQFRVQLNETDSSFFWKGDSSFVKVFKAGPAQFPELVIEMKKF